MSKSYTEFVSQQATQNLCLQGLVDFLQDEYRKQIHSVKFSYLDFVQGKHRPPVVCEIQPWDGILQTGLVQNCPVRDSPSTGSQPPRQNIRDRKLREVTTVPDEAHGRIVVVENIDQNTVSHLGALYNIQPLFFATYLDTEFRHLEERALPPTIAIAPSRTFKKDSIHLHYQRVLDLENACRQLKHTLKISGNVHRLVKPIPSLSDRSLALARTCCSILLRHIDQGKWICFVLVDPTNAELCSRNQHHKSNLKQKPLQGGTKNVCELPDFLSWEKSHRAGDVLQEGFNESVHNLGYQESLLNQLTRHFGNQSTLMSAHPPSLLDFTYYPAQLMISEWLQYSLLLSRYVKHYEYALVSSNLSLKQSKIEELLPWRRRCTQSLYKLELFRTSIERHIEQADSEAEKTWKPILRDIEHVSSQITHWAAFLNSMVPFLDTHHSLTHQHQFL